MSAAIATQLKGKPATQVLTDDFLLTLIEPDLLAHLDYHAKVEHAVTTLAPFIVTSASYSPKKRRYQLAIAVPKHGSVTIMVPATDIDTTGLH